MTAIDLLLRDARECERRLAFSIGDRRRRKREARKMLGRLTRCIKANKGRMEWQGG